MAMHIYIYIYMFEGKQEGESMQWCHNMPLATLALNNRIAQKDPSDTTMHMHMYIHIYIYLRERKQTYVHEEIISWSPVFVALVPEGVQNCNIALAHP